MVEFIMYHYVRDVKNSLFPKLKALDYNDFKFQINFLKKNYNIISIEEFYNNDFNKESKNCVLTFDDGYRDHYDFVFETLVKNNIKGAFYPPVDVVLSNKLLDVNKIHIILASAEEKKIFERLKFHYNLRNTSKNGLDFYIEKINKLCRYDNEITVLIKRLLQTSLDYELRQQLCDDLLKDFCEHPLKDLNNLFYLSIDQIVEMKDNGMHFGSHGKSHFWFESLNADFQEREIAESKFFLDNIYKAEPYLLTMCFPYGSYNKITIDLLKKYNYKIGLTTVPQIYNPDHNTFLEIPRLDTNDYPKSS